MALSHNHKEALATLEISSDRELRRRLSRYLAMSGLSPAEFAGKIGYSRIAITHFLSGLYSRISKNPDNTIALRAAIQSGMDADPVDLDERPEGTLYSTRNERILRKYFFSALDEGLAYYIHGNPGTQKTYVTEWLREEVRQADAKKNGSGRIVIYIYCQVNMRPQNLLREIATEIGIPSGGRVPQLMRKIRVALMGRRALILFDESQHMRDGNKHDCLETVRELHDRKPHIGMLFVGSHDLDEMFKGLYMEQWRSRINAGESLPGLQREEAEEIVRREIGARVPAAKINQLIDQCYSADDRKRVKRDEAPVQYLNARSLFKSITQIKKGMNLVKGATA